jgi:hypothetical protein
VKCRPIETAGGAETRSAIQRCREELATFETGEERFRLALFFSVSALCLRM